MMAKPKVLMTRKIPVEGFEIVRGCSDLEVWEGDGSVPRRIIIEKIPDREGLFCLLTDEIDAELLDRAPRLRVISTMAVGCDHIDVQECTRRGIPVGHTPDVLTESTADFAFALLMNAARRVVEAVDYVKAGRWETWSPTLFLGRDIHRATLGIVGFGRIGRAMARRATGFGMRVLVFHHEPIKSDAELGLRVQPGDFDFVLKESDFLTLHVPLTPETYHLIGEKELQRMKKTAVLINTARGAVVDSKALYQALRDGGIAYAALDVTEPEPIHMDDPLLSLPNCLIAPHIASASVATRAQMAVMAAENLKAGLQGERLPHCANPEVYRTQ